MSDDVLNSATRRVPLQFDKKGNPTFQSVKSPDSFKQNALCVKPPHTVIPVIFVPGIMGTNLKLQDKQNVQAWKPPNGTGEGISAVLRGSNQTPSDRQILFDPNNTAVNPNGPCEVSRNVCWLTTDEAKRRGWGALHADSYHSILQQLEISLNDQYSQPGRPQNQGNYLLPELGLLQYLGRDGSGSQRQAGQPDYAALAKAACTAWNTSPNALTEDDIKRLDDYYYPVWAHGYNWLQSNNTSAQSLVKKIDEVIAYYQNSDYFSCPGKVILVTHSMGGLVGRRAAQLAPDKILGVVHGVQPIAGAPVVYRRFRAGTEVGGFFDIESAAVAAIVGWDAADITPTLACSPGPLELLPTTHYPPGWLKVVDSNTGKEVISLPTADPYEEIYSKTTDDCWWGMIDPALIDPAGTIKNDKKQEPLDVCTTALKDARKFHSTLGLYAHPQTYGYYGIDDKKYRTFGHVSWQGRNVSNDALPLLYQKDSYRNLTGKSTVSVYDDGSSQVKLALSNERDQGGDGTVPVDSANVLAQLQPSPQAVFKIAGFDHQMSYKNTYAIQATIYSIARLVQLAPPPDPY